MIDPRTVLRHLLGLTRTLQDVDDLEAEVQRHPGQGVVGGAANLGGNITPIGSASTVVAVTVMHKHELPVSFVKFVKLAVPFAAVQIVLAIAYLVVFIR